MRWLWIIHEIDDWHGPNEASLRTEWTTDPHVYYGSRSTPVIIETERLIVYEWRGDIRFLIREDLLPVGWKEVFREGSRR